VTSSVSGKDDTQVIAMGNALASGFILHWPPARPTGRTALGARVAHGRGVLRDRGEGDGRRAARDILHRAPPTRHRCTGVRGGIRPQIARRGVAHGSGLGKIRLVIERGFAWLHAFKRLHTRYERRADIHLGLLQLACALIRHRQLAKSF
jgi:transposase